MIRLARTTGLWILVAVLALTGLGVWLSARSPASPLLLAGGTGQWIRLNRPYYMGVHPEKRYNALYRRKFRLAPGVPPPAIQIEAREEFVGFLDRMLFFEAPHDPGRRRQSRRVALPPGLAAGEHDLTILVRATRTEPVLRVEAPGLATDGTWEASDDGLGWVPAILAENPPVPEFTRAYPTALGAFLRVWPWLALAFCGGAGWSLLRERRGWRLPPAAAARWVFLALWAALAINNISRIPATVGMDVLFHLDYVKFIVNHHRLPLATEGWQMFQSPLAYLLSAPLFLLRPGIADETALQVLRVLPLACGLAQVEVAYRAVRALFPGRNGLQIAGTALGGFLPMNIYLSQTFGNEPLAGLLCSLAILRVLVRPPGKGLETGFALGLGGLLGLALLAKVTVLLLVPWFAIFCLFRARAEAGAGPGAALRFLALLGLGVALVAGWYFLWVKMHLGHFFVGGWDPARGIRYWQEPGYVTPGSLVSFGTALVWPVYAGTAGFWNGLYSTFWLDGTLSGQCPPWMVPPPWNYDFLLASTLTALAPCGAMVAGAAAAWRRPPVALGLACIGTLTLAILHLHITAVPSYATLKATYLIGLLPFFAILGAAGLEALDGRAWARALAAGLLSAWGLSAYAAYFVR